MLRVIYDARDGMAVPEGRVPEHVTAILESHHEMGNATIIVGQDAIVDELRLRIQVGDISHEDIVFVFEDQELHPTKYGVLQKWPRGFCDINNDRTGALLQNACKMRKEERNADGTATN